MDQAAAERIDALLQGGVAIIVASRDEELRTHITRGWAGRYDPTRCRFDLALTVWPGSRVVEDLEANGDIAVTLVDPTTYRSLQLTGTVDWIGAPTEQDRLDAAAHVARFVEAVESVGMPPGSAALAGPDLVAVQVQVAHGYDQTPGPGAGGPL